MKKIHFLAMLAMVATLFSSCQVIGDIFKAGFAVGIIVVLLVVFLLVWLISKFRK